MKRQIVAACCLAGAVALGFIWLGSSGQAAERRLLTEPEMRTCICLTRSLESRKEDVEVHRAIFENRRAALSDLDRTWRERTDGVEEADPAEVEALRLLLARQRGLEGQLRRDTLPDYRDAVLAYNQTVERYNAQCGDANYRERTIEEARKALDCPVE